MIPDYLFYGKFHLLAYNFALFNVVEGKSEIFGVLRWSAYLDTFIPDYLNILYPFGVLGIILFIFSRPFFKKELVIPLTILSNVFFYSSLAHKEIR
jgi:hypothetical protein